MIVATNQRGKRLRPGVAAAELAILAPLLAFIFLVTVDWARIFYYAVVLENCARNGAYYASDYGIYDYQNPPDAALEDTTNLTPAPVITIMYSNGPGGPYNMTSPPGSYMNGGAPAYAQVTATWTFNTITSFSLPPFGIANNVTLARSVDMEMAPIVPSFQ
jgi:Flp pilus assembly protein TadG